MAGMGVEVRRARPDEASELKRLRLEMLRDSPSSFVERLERVEAWDEGRWTSRLTSMSAPDSALFIAAEDDAWVAQAGGRLYGTYVPPRAYLLSVYVTPSRRGRRLVEQVVERVEDWARGLGFNELYLDVHEGAAAARIAYARMGYVETGVTTPYANDEAESEIELAKQLE